jgi:Planctomycete cytochrome C
MTASTPSSCMKALPFVILFAIAGCQKEATISYAQDIKPITDKYCLECHQPGGEGHVASGFSVASYADLMQGTRNGPMVIAGDSMGSNMLVLMEGRADPSIKMPHGQSVSASKAEIETLRLWIDQGARDN